MIIYKYLTIVQPIVLKYELVLIIEDEDVKIIFSTVSSHHCLSDVELYLDVQLIENTKLIPDQHDYKVANQDIEPQDSKQIRASNPYVVDNIPMKYQFKTYRGSISYNR